MSARTVRTAHMVTENTRLVYRVTGHWLPDRKPQSDPFWMFLLLTDFIDVCFKNGIEKYRSQKKKTFTVSNTNIKHESTCTCTAAHA